MRTTAAKLIVELRFYCKIPHEESKISNLKVFSYAFKELHVVIGKVLDHVSLCYMARVI